MKYKLIPIKDGKVDLSLNELSAMLEEAYENGYKDGKEAMPKASPTKDYCNDSEIYKVHLGKPWDGDDWSYLDMFRVHYEKPNAVWTGDDWSYKPTKTAADTYDSDYVVVNSNTYTTDKGSNDTTTEYNEENITFTKILEDLLKK